MLRRYHPAFLSAALFIDLRRWFQCVRVFLRLSLETDGAHDEFPQAVPFSLILLLTLAASASDYYRHPFFDNSITTRLLLL
jgi:hypothetical protein